MHIRFTTGQSMLRERSNMKRIEFVQLRRQMEILTTFMPDYTLSKCDTELKESDNFVGVLLDIHISGMHQLIEKFHKVSDGGIYKLTATLNAYLSAIIEAVTYWGGDVLKIHGDSCLNLWKVSTNESLYEVLHFVLTCACIIRDALNDFNTTIGLQLKLKMAIACGNIQANTYGLDNKIVVFRGKPLCELRTLRAATKPNDIFISLRAWAHMMQERYEVVKLESGIIKLLSGRIAYKATERGQHQLFTMKELEVREIITKHFEYMHILHANPRIDTNIITSKLTTAFIQRIPARECFKVALRQCNYQNLRAFVCKTVQYHVDEHRPVEYLTEILTLTTQVICLSPNSVKCLGDVFMRYLYHQVSNMIGDSHAFIYKFEVTHDVKIVIISGFHDLRKDLESQRALRSGYSMIQRFHEIPGVEHVSVGVFHGYLYCGVLGHPFRRDYVVLGATLKKAFSVIDKHKGRVICDYKTFKFSKLSSFYFRCLGSRRCGFSFEHRQVFVYDENVEDASLLSKSAMYTDKDKPIEVYGRDAECQQIRELLQSGHIKKDGDDRSIRCLVFSADELMGKSTLLHYAQNLIGTFKHFAIASLVLQEDTTHPYFVITKLYRQLYDMYMRLQADFISVLTLPMQLINYHRGSSQNKEDLALTKYRILTQFRELVEVSNCVCIFIIDNAHFMDMPSWEILDIVLDTCNVRFLAAGDFSDKNDKVGFLFRYHKRIKFMQLQPLSDYWINTIACTLLNVAALSKQLLYLLSQTCSGLPGYLQNCLTYLINGDLLHLRHTTKKDLTKDFVPMHAPVFDRLPQLVNVMEMWNHSECENVKQDRTVALTIVSITSEFYNSLESFEQAILKAGSVLGEIFTKNLLICALHYPDRELLMDGIQTLFEKGIFECGSAYVNGYPISVNKYCCRCFMDEDELTEMNGAPKYRYCKIFRFRNQNIKYIAYNLMPVNQKKDLHLMCTDVLEHTLHFCPRCLRDPINSFIVCDKYSEVVEYCRSGEFNTTYCPTENSGYLKERIRMMLRNEDDDYNSDSVDSMRHPFNPLECNCFEILLFVYKQLVYHSSHAKNLGKRIFFISVYGYVLLLVDDVTSAIAALREAYELCFVNVGAYKCEISEAFRRYHVNKIAVSMALAFIQLRQIGRAKNQMAIALRQCRLPSLVFHYAHFQLLLKKTRLASVRRHVRERYALPAHPGWMRWSLGMSMVVCAKIFAIEGNMKYAAHCSDYSVWLLQAINPRIPMLLDRHCNAIDFYRYGLDVEICEKLQCYVLKEVLLNYCNNRAFFARNLMHMMVTEFELAFNRGRLNEAIRMCYRIIDYSMKVYIFITHYEVVIWIGLLFTYTLRFKDYLDIMKVISVNVYEDSRVWYYANALIVPIMTGFAPHINVEMIVKEITGFINFNPHERLSWEKNHLLSLLYLYLFKMEGYANAERFRPRCPFSSSTLNKPIVMRILLNIIEASLLDLLQAKRRKASVLRINGAISQHFELATGFIKKMRVLQPRYYCLLAWRFRLNDNEKRATKYLLKARRISRENGDLYHECFVSQLQHSWSGSSMAYNRDKWRSINDTLHYTTDDWTQALIPFPVD